MGLRRQWIGRRGLAAANCLSALSLIAVIPAASEAQWYKYGCQATPSCGATLGGAGVGDMAMTGPAELPAESFAESPLDLGEAAPAQIGEFYAAYTPNFVGDFFGGPLGEIVVQSRSSNFPLTYPAPASGGLTGIQKLAENSSPIPRNRILFNYSYYNNVQFTPAGQDVNRYVAGFEKTLFDQMFSIELRAPFASTLNSNIYPDGQATGTDTEFGNLTIYAKALMLAGKTYAIGAGLGVSAPTADGINLLTPTGEPLIRIENEAVQLLPYVGIVYAPNERFFAQGLLQIDTVTSGNPVYFNDPQTGSQLAGTLNDPTWLFASVNVGYWTYRADPSQRLSGISPLFEVHYNATLQDTDVIADRFFQIGETLSNVEMVNCVAGVNLEFFGRTYLSLAYVAPVTNGPDRFFDGELRVLFNRYFW